MPPTGYGIPVNQIYGKYRRILLELVSLIRKGSRAEDMALSKKETSDRSKVELPAHTNTFSSGR